MKGLNNKITKIIKRNSETFSVQIQFADGAQGWISLENIFEKPKGLATQVLKGGLFTSCFIDSGALAWPNGLELCPDSLYMKLKSKKKSRGTAA